MSGMRDNMAELGGRCLAVMAAWGLRMLLAAGGGVLLFVAVFTLKRQIAPSVNVLAECAMVLMVCAPVVLAMLVVLYRKSVLTSEGTVAAGLIFLLASACFWLTVPAIFDRSVTLYLINILDNNEQGMTHEEIEDEFINVYFSRSEGISKRLQEQIDSGNIHYSGSRYHITDGGRRTLFMARVLSRVYALDPEIVRKQNERRQRE